MAMMAFGTPNDIVNGMKCIASFDISANAFGGAGDTEVK